MTAAEPWHWDLATTRGGRRSPTRCWQVKDAAGQHVRLSGLQLAAYRWISWQHEHGRHRYLVRELAEAIGASPGTASKILRRLRSMSLVGGRHPNRGRLGGVMTWLPGRRSAAADQRVRRDRWPTFVNVSTFTSYAGFLTREGVQRSVAAMSSGHPPGSAGPPAGWAAASRSPRARGRPWPPPMVNERCPLKSASAALRLAARIDVGPDLALVYAGPCSKGRHDHAAALVLAGDARPRIAESAGLVAARITGRAVEPPPAPTPAQVEHAAAMVGLVDERLVDELRVRYLGWRRPEPYRPIVPAVATGPTGSRDELVADQVARCRLELARVRAARVLLPPS